MSEEDTSLKMETCNCIYQTMEVNLEIISECVLDSDLKLLKEKYIEHCLNLTNVESSIVHYKNKCLTTYTNNGERIYLSNAKYFELIKELNKFELNYIFLTHSPHISRYIKKILTKYKDQICGEDDFLYTSAKNTELVEQVKKISPNIYHTLSGSEVEKVLGLEKIEPNFFEVKDWKTKENIQKIEKGIMPTYSHTNHNKINLLQTLRSHGNLYLSDTDIVDIIRNNNLPYMNYQDLKNMLQIIHQDHQKNDIQIFDNLPQAFMHGLCLSKEKTNFILLNEGNHYLCYSSNKLKNNHENPESYLPTQKEDYSLENRIIHHLFKEKPENIVDKQVPFEGKSIDYFNTLNNYIIENNNPDFEILLSTHPYTRKEKILNRFIDVNVDYTSTNIVEIYVTYNKKEILLVKDFYLPKDMEDSIVSCIKLLWSSGYLLNDYGYNYYIKYNKILSKSICAPWWLQASNMSEIKSLIKFINQLKDAN